MVNIKDVPFPPLEMKKLVGPIEDKYFENKERGLVFPDIPISTYDFVFDFGCGCGRTARQLIQQNPEPKRYIGVDLHKGMIEWCKKNLMPYANGFDFFHQDIYNVGLNPDGQAKMLPFPIKNNEVTLFIAHSVFTHVNEEAAEFYLKELSRVMNPKGIAITTWFLFDKSDFPMMQDFQNALFINDVDITNAVIFDKKWLLNNCNRVGLSISKIISPIIRGFQYQIYMEKIQFKKPHVSFPEDIAPKGINRPPLLSENAHKIGLNLKLMRIYSSREWKFVIFLQKVTNIAIPKGSPARKIIVFLYNLSKKIIKIILKIKRISSGLFLQAKNYFIKVKPREKRKINPKSKKIVFIDHSYHTKTKSSEFLTDYLKIFFDVEIIQDDSWQGKPFVDLSFIDDSYLCVIFWQSLPSPKLIKSIKNDNIVYFPMYDGVRHDYEFWNQYRNLKIINFSKTLHDKLSKWGLESIYVQYFPKSDQFIPGNKEEVFFWQRLTKMNINTITKLFKYDVKIHIFKAIDPGQKFVQPSEKTENKFKITYSDWFESQKEMFDIIEQKGIYIAPRELEGIGLSFLEAMAMGKAIIAVDNPTMNEYIKNGENGYLFDLKNPKEIDLSNIEQIQKNCYEFMKNGYKKWEQDKGQIIDFIKK